MTELTYERSGFTQTYRIPQDLSTERAETILAHQEQLIHLAKKTFKREITPGWFASGTS